MSDVHWHFGNRLSWRRGRMLHVRIGWFAIERSPSWEWPGVRAKYGRRGFWFRNGGFTARWRDWLVMFR